MYEGLETLSGSKAQKLAKKYLSGDRMDLVLWNGFAQAEKSQGRIPEVSYCCLSLCAVEGRRGLQQLICMALTVSWRSIDSLVRCIRQPCQCIRLFRQNIRPARH